MTIPRTYQEWEHCITVKCGIELTPQFVAKRIAALTDENDFHTKKFIENWGKPHHTLTLQWFQQAAVHLQQSAQGGSIQPPAE